MAQQKKDHLKKEKVGKQLGSKYKEESLGLSDEVWLTELISFVSRTCLVQS